MTIKINGTRANRARLFAPCSGRWFADVELGGAAPSGAATLELGAAELEGTIVPDYAGAFVGTAKVRVVGGAGGWSKDVPARSYHNDAGVRRSDVVAALAGEVGEPIDVGTDAVRLAIRHTRRAGPAARALDEVLDGTTWRVDYDGITRYGARPAAQLGSGAELLDADPKTGVLTFAAPDPSHVPIGAVVSDKRLSRSITIGEIDAVIEPGRTRITAWGASTAVTEPRLFRALRALLPRFFPREPYAYPRKYRVIRMRPGTADATLTRFELQIVTKAAGFPDMLLVDAWPGIAGGRAEVMPGALVLVSFIDGDKGQPIVTHFATADDPAFKPVNTVLDASSSVKIGKSAASVELASGSDSVETPNEIGRVIRYGDPLVFPVGSAGTPTVCTAVAFTATPGAPPTPLVSSSVAKVKAN